MLTYDIVRQKNIPMYDALYRCIKEDILSGKLGCNEKLPSKRKLAEHLGISKVTVENAYAQLSAEGYIYSVEKKGFFVDEVQSTPPVIKKQTAEAPPQSESYPVDLTVSHLSEKMFPFSVWSRLMRRVMLDYNKELLIHLPWDGALILRKAISDFLLSFRGLSVSPENIIIGSGTEYLYNLLIQLLGRDKLYAMENPGYRKIKQIYSANGVACTGINLDSSGVCISELEESGADVLHISPSHHYPTGISTPVKRRQELLAWAAEADSRYIIEDDYDCEFRFSGMPIPPLQSLDSEGKVIYMNTFSKSIAPSMRISYAVLPDGLLEQFKQKLSFYSCTVPSFEQYTLAHFISEGCFEKHIARMKKYYRLKRQEILNIIKDSPLKSRMKAMQTDTGLHFLLKVDTAKSDSEIRKCCAQKGLKIELLSDCYLFGSPGDLSTFIINYAGIEIPALKQAVDIIEDII